MRKLILVKHSLPEIVPGVPWYEWHISAEGRRRCVPLADKLADYQPVAIASSTERKARETAEFVADRLRIPIEVTEGLQENDRTGLVFTSQEQYETQIAGFFHRSDELVIGRETASEALDRFSRAVEDFVSRHPEGDLVVVAHGTVITLFVAAHSGSEPFPFWQQLGLPSLVVLSLPDHALLETVAGIA